MLETIAVSVRTQQIQSGFGSLAVLPFALFLTRVFVPWFHRRSSGEELGGLLRRGLNFFTWVFVLALGVGGIVEICVGVFGLAPN